MKEKEVTESIQLNSKHYLYTMVRDKLIFVLLLPFTLLYAVGVWLRNLFYDKGLLKSVAFDIPIISVGNLSVGGAGKTPHIEYLILLLREHIQLATLSRGYKRKTTGYLLVQPHMDATQCGDEPLQFKRKFPEVQVAVSESRVLGVPKLLGEVDTIQTILLDDAFQHRGIKPGLNILLTSFQKPYYEDFLLPSGRLRESAQASQRADVIIVSKCPQDEKLIPKDTILQKLDPLPHQRVFFSYYIYGQPYYLYNSNQRVRFSKEQNIILVSAIANTDYLLDYLNDQLGFVHNLAFEDHHQFTPHEMGQLKRVYDNMDLPNKYIVTTEKDAVRIDTHREFLIQNQLPVFVLPVRVKFHFQEGPIFDDLVKNFLLEFQV